MRDAMLFMRDAIFRVLTLNVHHKYTVIKCNKMIPLFHQKTGRVIVGQYIYIRLHCVCVLGVGGEKRVCGSLSAVLLITPRHPMAPHGTKIYVYLPSKKYFRGTKTKALMGH